MSITSNSEKHSILLVCLFAVTLPLVTRRAVAATTTRRPARRRRTQAERTAAMRARLLDATVTSLAEVGYARTTTAAVAGRAGVSRGAQMHHFPTKAELPATAVESVFDRLHAQFLEAVDDLPADVERASAAIDVLWPMFNSPTFKAWLELVIAARTDDDLRPLVAEVENRLAARVATTFFQLFPPPGGHLPDRAAAAPVLLFSVLMGLAVQRLVEGGPDFSDSVLPVVKELVPHVLEAS